MKYMDKSIEELANALIAGEVKAQDVGMKPVFRLHPPRKGYKGIQNGIQNESRG